MKKVMGILSVIAFIFVTGCTSSSTNSFPTSAINDTTPSSSTPISSENSVPSSKVAEPKVISETEYTQTVDTANFVLLSDTTNKFSLTTGDTYKNFSVESVEYTTYKGDSEGFEKGLVSSARAVFLPTTEVTLTGTLSYGAGADSPAYVFILDENSESILPIIAEVFAGTIPQGDTFRFVIGYTEECLSSLQSSQDEKVEFFLDMLEKVESSNYSYESEDSIHCTITLSEYSTTYGAEMGFNQGIMAKSIAIDSIHKA